MRLQEVVGERRMRSGDREAKSARERERVREGEREKAGKWKL